MNSDLSVPVQYLNYMIISTASSEIRLLEVEQACQTAFFIFLSSLLIARGIGEEWSFYMLGVFFNTVLLSPLFFPLPAYIPSHVKSNLYSLLHLNLIFLCSYIYLPLKVSSLLKLYSYSFNAITRFFLGPLRFSLFCDIQL